MAKKMTEAQMVEQVRRGLREDFGDRVGLGSIPVDRLRAEIARAENGEVTVKIPSYSEITMSVRFAQAVLSFLTR